MCGGGNVCLERCLAGTGAKPLVAFAGGTESSLDVHHDGETERNNSRNNCSAVLTPLEDREG
jgi:hypothetical protein